MPSLGVAGHAASRSRRAVGCLEKNIQTSIYIDLERVRGGNQLCALRVARWAGGALWLSLSLYIYVYGALS